MKFIFILALLSLLVFAVASIIKERRFTKIVRYASCGATVVFSLIAGIAAPTCASWA